MNNRDDYRRFAKNNFSLIKDIHAHNAFLGGKDHFGFNKKGNLKLKEIIDFLDKLNYRNYFTFEILGDEDIIESWGMLQEYLGK